MSETIDQKINELFLVVRNQKTDVELSEKQSKQSWKTNCTIHFDKNTSPINIQTASEAVIKNIIIELLKLKDYANRAEEILGLAKSEIYDGFSFEDWITDCKKRITVMSLRNKKEKLIQLETRLNALVSPEQKRQMELDAITNLLNS